MLDVNCMRIRHFLALAITMGPVLSWLFFNMAVIARGPSVCCPKCGGKRTRRSGRRRADLFLPAFIAPRRCEVCRARFYNLKSVNYSQRHSSARVPRQVRQPELPHAA
jgi:hypothetical protein